MQSRIKYQIIASLFLLASPVIFSCVSFAQSVQFSSGSSMDFGLIEFASSHSGTLTLGTNGAVIMTASGLSYEGNATAGHITIEGNSGIVELKCADTASIGGAISLQITDIEISAGSGVGPGSAQACHGTGGSDASVLAVDLGATPDIRIYFGGKLNIPPNSLGVSGSHSSSQSGGNAINLSAVFQ